MHVVVNHLPLARPLDPELIARFESELIAEARKNPAFVDLQLVRVGDTEAMIIVQFENLESLQAVSSAVAAPWFAANVRHRR